jgi:hypothetical protein
MIRVRSKTRALGAFGREMCDLAQKLIKEEFRRQVIKNQTFGVLTQTKPSLYPNPIKSDLANNRNAYANK